MSYVKGTFFYLVFFLYLSIYCKCQCHGISTREAKSFFDTQGNSYLMSNDFMTLYMKKDRFKELTERKMAREDVKNNRMQWGLGIKTSTTTESPTTKNLWIPGIGETEKIITVRVSSSVARSTYYTGRTDFGQTGKQGSSSLQQIGYNLVPDYSQFPEQQMWLTATTESPSERDGSPYYETRIEAVSSRQHVVFGKPVTKVSTSTRRPEPMFNAYYSEPEVNFYELPEMNYELPEKNYELPEKNFEMDEAVNFMTGEGDGSKNASAEKNKLGYVTDGRDYRKYRVEERTPDGFIVGEYGFVRHEDGKLHGVRYTADVTANPRLIYDALVKFLSL